MPAGAHPESTAARAARQLGWLAVDLILDEEVNEPTLVLRPGALDATVEIAMSPGLPTFVVVAGPEASEAWNRLRAVMPHHHLDEVLEEYWNGTSISERVKCLQILAGAAIGSADDPQVIAVVLGALADPAHQVRASALLVAASSLDAFDEAVRAVAASDPDAEVAAVARQLIASLDDA